MTEPLRLTALSEAARARGPGALASPGTWRRWLFTAFMGTREVLGALPRDLGRLLPGRTAAPMRMEEGVELDAAATRIALYVHYSASGRISDMVQHQLAALRALGFSLVFISMSGRIPDADWEAVRQHCALVVQRRNFGLDFGAWRDLLPEVRRRWSVPEEVLLANDSVLGPIHALAPAFDTMRAAGDGLFGLTESLQSGPHLQSYLLLARGTAVVEDLMRFMRRLHVSHSKWLLVRMGEVRLSRWMRRRGHRVAALFGYDRLVRAAIADPEERQRLETVYRRLENLERMPTEAAVDALHRWPLNPTHHLWRVLATQFGYPFLKTELIRRNPVHLPGVTRWRDVVPPDSPCKLATIEAHLATLDAHARDATEPGA